MDNTKYNELKAAYERLYDDYNYLLERYELLEKAVASGNNHISEEEYDSVMNEYFKIKNNYKKIIANDMEF